ASSVGSRSASAALESRSFFISSPVVAVFVDQRENRRRARVARREVRGFCCQRLMGKRNGDALGDGCRSRVRRGQSKPIQAEKAEGAVIVTGGLFACRERDLEVVGDALDGADRNQRVR